MSSPPPLKHRLEYLGFRILRAGLSIAPQSVALAFGSVLGWFFGSVLRLRRDVVDDNLARAFPEESPAWRRRVAAASYRHLVREAVVTFRMGASSREQILEMTEIERYDEFQEIMADGKGIVMATGHLGNWEMAGAAFAARGVPVDAVVQLQRNARFDEDLRATRERLGMTVVPKQVAPKGILRGLRRGRLAALVADQNVARAGIFVDFFGVPAATARGPAVFALRSGAPFWVAAGIRKPEGGYRVRVRPVVAPVTGDMETDVEALTQAYVQTLEEWVREVPEQYFWQHRRWKTRPAIPEPTS